MMGGVSPETCWTIKKHWNNKFYCTVASFWFFLWDLCYDARIHDTSNLVNIFICSHLIKNLICCLLYKDNTKNEILTSTVYIKRTNYFYDTRFDSCDSAVFGVDCVNPLNAELNPICYFLALLGAHYFLHVSRIRVKSLTLRLLMPYIYIWSTNFWCF